MNPKSELAWRLSDYERAGEEPPERILANPKACEGELMTLAEVDDFIRDCVATMLIMLDRGSERFEEIRTTFLADLDCLLELGKIDADEYNEITSSEEFNL
ncbi:MAG TPA: hypothetical protein VLE72_00685 [Candidatus Saccharimonadales bacterium]|nr:hypothetical protein [Candidatus Saccharimonadales bacterium]